MSRAIVWFRRDLSLDDNRAWCVATAEHDEVLPVFVVDDHLLRESGPWRRAQFLASVSALDAEIRARWGALSILRGSPQAALARLAREHDVVAAYWNRDVSGWSVRRDDTVRELSRVGVSVHCSWNAFVHDPGSILTQAGTVPRVFTRFHERWAALPLPSTVAEGPAHVLAVEKGRLPDTDRLPLVPAGPAAAWQRLAGALDRIGTYVDTRDDPDLDVTSHLSIDLHLGTISAREVLHAVRSAGTASPAFARQLAWRDWYGHLFAERPELGREAQQPKFDQLAWRNDPDEITAWKSGHTGYPFVDAGMRQLAATGWMNNRTRMVAASFLVKELLVDWRIGERHFRRLLLDGDIAQNAGNWQWVAGTGPDAAPCFRILNPLTQARRFDPHGAFTRRWIPELADLPDADIHAPWELGPLELESAGVQLGTTYPTPIVDRAHARTRGLAAYAAVAKATPGD